MKAAHILQSLNAYPMPAAALSEIAIKRGVELADEVSSSLLSSKAYRLAKADVFMWLSLAPNISQGGQSYSFSESERKALKAAAQAIYGEYAEEDTAAGVAYGYKGSRL